MVCIDKTYSFPKNPSGMIVLEGVNGAGKSSLQKRIGQFLIEQGKAPLLSREPGAGTFGKTIRQILLTEDQKPKSDLAELFLFNADRAEHVHAMLTPALAKKQPVVLDRYFYSTLAFQGYGRELALDTVESVCMLAIQGLLPDLVILLDLDPEIGLQRNKKDTDTQGAAEEDQFEQEALAFHTRLRNGFLQLAETRSEAFLVVDASLSPEEIDAAVFPVLEHWHSTLQEQWYD